MREDSLSKFKPDPQIKLKRFDDKGLNLTITNKINSRKFYMNNDNNNYLQ